MSKSLIRKSLAIRARRKRFPLILKISARSCRRRISYDVCLSIDARAATDRGLRRLRLSISITRIVTYTPEARTFGLHCDHLAAVRRRMRSTDAFGVHCAQIATSRISRQRTVRHPISLIVPPRSPSLPSIPPCCCRPSLSLCLSLSLSLSLCYPPVSLKS